MSKIEWTGDTLNFIVGCKPTSPGCANCYAIQASARQERFALGKSSAERAKTRSRYYIGLTEKQNEQLVWTGIVRQVPEAYHLPLKTKKPQLYFLNAMSDPFYEEVPWEWIDEMMVVMAIAYQHTFQMLTKRADRQYHYFMSLPERADAIAHAYTSKYGGDPVVVAKKLKSPLRNLWVGITVEDEKRLINRIPYLLLTPAAIRWVSFEPLLTRIVTARESVNHQKIADRMRIIQSWDEELFGDAIDFNWISHLDWAVVGGESGTKARQFNLHWAIELVKAFQELNRRIFVKQMGSAPIMPPLPNVKATKKTLGLKSQGKDFDAFPPSLRVREYPNRLYPTATQ